MEDFVRQARDVTVPSQNGPVHVKDAPSPIIPINRWQLEDKKQIRKRFIFDTVQQKGTFVFHLMQYEETSGYHAMEIKIGRDWVELLIGSPSLQSVTDLDKEYAKQADVLYKDVCYIPMYEP